MMNTEWQEPKDGFKTAETKRFCNGSGVNLDNSTGYLSCKAWPNLNPGQLH